MTDTEWLWTRVKRAQWLLKHATTAKGRAAAEGVFKRATDAYLREAGKLPGVATTAPISETRRRAS